MDGSETSFLGILNADNIQVDEDYQHHTQSSSTAADVTMHNVTDQLWQGQLAYDGVWDEDDDEGGLEDAEGEEEDDDYALNPSEIDEAYFMDDQDEVDQIPIEIGRQLDRATVDAGITAQGHAKVLYEEDEEAMKEINESMAHLDPNWEGLSGAQRRRRKARRRATQLTDDQTKIMGQANLAYAKGEHTSAVKLLHELIKAVPQALQAWVTLAAIYDELGEVEQSMRAYMMAAHLSPRDTDLWTRLGAMSRKWDQEEQALYCFIKAIRADPNNVDALWNRADIYGQRGEVQKAMEDLEALLHITPHNMTVVKALSKLYLKVNKPSLAIALFEGALQADLTNPLTEEEPEESAGDEDEEVIGHISMGTHMSANTRMGYEELNMLAELYMEIRDYEKTLVAIIQGCRRIQGRANERYRDQYDDDRVFTEDNLPENRIIPVELQVKLGICRLWLNSPDVAKLHFRQLYASAVNDYADQYWDVAEAYMGKRMFTSALEVFSALEASSKTSKVPLWDKMGQCHQELGNLETAVEFYNAVLHKSPDHDSDIKLRLARAYDELGEDELALDLISAVGAESPISEQAQGEQATPVPAAPGSFQSFIVEKERSSRKPRDKAMEEAAEAAKQAENQSAYQKIAQLYPKVRDKITRADLQRTARKLLTRFQNTRAFYPSDRSKIFTGIIKKGKRATTIDKKTSDLNHQPKPVNVRERTEQLPMSVDGFQGLTFDKWYDAFIKYAYTAVMDGKEEEAQIALKSAFDANVFYHDEMRRIRLRLHMISVAIYAGNAARVTENCRWFCHQQLFANDTYRLYTAMQAGGSEAVSCYAMSASAKYFRRQLKEIEAGLATSPRAPEYNNPLLMATYGHILTAGRSYLAAIAFYLKAYKLAPKDPMINFSLGLAHLHRAMQRKSDNRHLHIMQGFTFIMRYHELRGENMEASFNVARAFHQLGLNHLAIPYYQKVLELSDSGQVPDPSLDLRGEAAYNLSLIYVSNGSMGLAEQLLRKYCTA